MGANHSSPSPSTAAGASPSSAAASERTSYAYSSGLHLLRGCDTPEEHESAVRDALSAARGPGGEGGLAALGFEFRFVPCGACRERAEGAPESCGTCASGAADAASPPQSTLDESASQSNSAGGGRLAKSASAVSLFSDNSDPTNERCGVAAGCHGCATRLFHVGKGRRGELFASNMEESGQHQQPLSGSGKGANASRVQRPPRSSSSSGPIQKCEPAGDDFSGVKGPHVGEECNRAEESREASAAAPDGANSISNEGGLPKESEASEESQNDSEGSEDPASAAATDAETGRSSGATDEDDSGGPMIDANATTATKSAPASETAASSVRNTSRADGESSKEAAEVGDSCTPDEDEDAIMITPSNRKEFIADGAMYELVANLAQEAAQERMCRSFDLEWVTVCDDHHLGERVRAMVDRDHRRLLDEGENRWVLQEILDAVHDDGMGCKEEKKEDGDIGDSGGSRTEPRQQQHRQLHAVEPPKSSNRTRSTLLIATGRGKVRAGIFSRHHLLTAGIEVGTSWHCVREARMRRWGVAIVDPNARGEGAGFDSFRRSVSRLFSDRAGGEDGEDDSKVSSGDNGSSKGGLSVSQKRNGTSLIPPRLPSQASLSTLATTSTSSSSQRRSIYILAHSASGGQLVRHLREDPALLPSIRAVAFTDSTHNVQWAKHDPTLQSFLQAKSCVYLRSNDVRSSQSCVRVSSRGKDIWCDCEACANGKKGAGREAETDGFWEHRFGSIRTLWAGTADHALSNWAGHASIWDHFDEHASDDDDDEGDGGVGAGDGVMEDGVAL